MPKSLRLAIAALAGLFLAGRAEASLTRATSPALEASALTLTAPAPEPSEFSLFEGDELTHAAAESARAPSFHPLAAVSLLDERVECELATPLELSYPKTRYRVFELLGTPILEVERGVTLELRWGSSEFRAGLASGTVGWLSQDPLGDVDSPNLYGFVGMRPHEKTDPMGLMSEGDILGRYLDDLDVMPRAEAQARDRARRALSAEMDAQERAGRPSIVGSVLGDVWGWVTGKGRQAQAASDRIENTLAGGARDLSTNVVPPSTRPVDRRDQRLPGEYGGGPTANDRLARAQNELSTTAGDVAEGGTRFGYQTGRDYFILGTTGKVIEELRAARRTGSYTIKFGSGKRYHGKGPETRAADSARRVGGQAGDPAAQVEWTPAISDREAFKDEARRIRADRGVGNPENYNKINSPGEKLLKQDEPP